MPHQKLIKVVDDFFPDPLVVRDAALTQDYVMPQIGPGKAKAGGIAKRVATPEKIYIDTLERIGPHLDSEPCSSTIEFRYTTQDTVKRNVCHADGADFAGIVYLTLPEDCQGGTCFYQHKKTGHYFRDPDAGDVYDFKNPDDWELVYKVDMQFNRLVFYPGLLFHAITTPFFGTTIENARLTTNLFIEVSQFDVKLLKNAFVNS